MARRTFKAGVDQPPRDHSGFSGSFGITERGPNDTAPDGDPTKRGDWVNRITVHGDPALRDRIVELLNAHGVGE